MSSPIHRALFSPPPSPPSRSKELKELHANHGLTSLKSLLLPADLMPKGPLEGYSYKPTPIKPGAELKVRSPRTPSRREFFRDESLPTAYPEAPRISISEDIEATPRASTTSTSTPRTRSTEKMSSPVLNAHNVPSTSIPVPASLPRPLIRLLFFATLLFSSAMILVYIPGARIPSLHAASIARRFSLDIGGKGHTIAELSSWQSSLDRDYSPPQIRAPHMLKRAFAGGSELDRVVPPPLKAIRPTMIPRPLPESHELLAIQSYLLDSAYNILPDDIDATKPIDANKVSSHKLGKPGSAEEQAYFDDLIKEKGQDVVIWYGGDGNLQLPHGVLDILHGIHGADRHPLLLPCHGRSDMSILRTVFNRLNVPFSNHPLIMIGNNAIVGDAKNMEQLSATGALTKMLREIGWVQEESEDTEESVVETSEVFEDEY